MTIPPRNARVDDLVEIVRKQGFQAGHTATPHILPKLREALATLTHGDLYQSIPNDKHADDNLLGFLTIRNLGTQIAHLLTDKDYLYKIVAHTLAGHKRVLHTIAHIEFPNKYFPHHLLTDEIMLEKYADGHASTLLHTLATAAHIASLQKTVDIPDDLYNGDTLELDTALYPVFHLDPKWFAAKYLFARQMSGQTPLGSLLRCGKLGRDILRKYDTLNQTDPSLLVETTTKFRPPLATILLLGAPHLIRPERLASHSRQAFNIGRNCLHTLKTNPQEGLDAERAIRDLTPWLAKITQLALGNPRP